MSQHDYDLANQAGTAFRADLNSSLAAIVSQNSGATAPATTFAYQWWADTTTGLLKIRNAANSAWITVGTLAAANLGLLPLAGGALTGGINEARGSLAMHATTMALWAQPNIIDGTSSAVTITAIANAPQAGARRVLYPVAASVITNGATFAVDGAANATAAAGDAWEFEAVTTSTYKVHITKKDGTALVGTTETAWTDYSATSTIVGWSSYTTKMIYYKDIGKTRFVTYVLAGTSNSTSTTFTVPSASSNTADTVSFTRIMDNSVEGAVGIISLPMNSSTVTCYRSALAAWTGSGTKVVAGQFTYQLP